MTIHPTITDADRKPFERGLYCEGDPAVGAEHVTYFLYKGGQGDKALEITRADGRVLRLGIPQGMPDSSRMPEGQIEAARLRRMSDNYASYRARETNRLAEKFSADKTFFEKNLK